MKCHILNIVPNMKKDENFHALSSALSTVLYYFLKNKQTFFSQHTVAKGRAVGGGGIKKKKHRKSENLVWQV